MFFQKYKSYKEVYHKRVEPFSAITCFQHLYEIQNYTLDVGRLS